MNTTLEEGGTAGRQALVGRCWSVSQCPFQVLWNDTSPPFIILLKAVALSLAFQRGLKRKSVCYKLTMAGHRPRSPASWTLALPSPSQILSLLGPVTVPGPARCSSWAHSPRLLIFLPVCQSSAVFRIILLHVVGGEPANLGRDEEVVKAASAVPPAAPQPTSGPLHLPYLLPQK